MRGIWLRRVLDSCGRADAAGNSNCINNGLGIFCCVLPNTSDVAPKSKGQEGAHI